MAQTHDETLLAVLEAVSNRLGTPVDDLPPLSESISLDGLEAVTESGKPDDVTVGFSYAGLRVFVHSGEFVYVRPTDQCPA